MAITPEQQQAMNNMAGIQFAMPQSVVPVTKKTWSSQSTQYDPNKMQALRDALGLPRPKMTWQEALANTLSQAQNPQAFTGGFGEQFVDPFGTGFASLARGFGNTYGVRAANAREIAEKEREDAIKMAELENEAAKRTVSSQVMDDYVKFNDPNAKGAATEQQRVRTVDGMLNELEEIGTRFDDDFKNIDDMEKNETRLGRESRGALWGIGRSTDERQALNDFMGWQGNIKNVLVDANRKAGSGTMSDADAARYEQGISQAKSLPEARAILRQFKKRLELGMDENPVNNRTSIQEAQAMNAFMSGNL